MGNLDDQAKRTIYSNSLARRNFFIRPPEPPEDFLMGDPANSIYIGRTKIFHVPFHWSYKNVTNPHIAIVGISGAGKSYFVKTFLTRASFVWGANAFIIDWAGEYKDWVKQTGGKVISLGKGSYINLLDLAGMKPIDRVKQVIRTLEILTDLGQYPEQRRLTELSIDEAYARKGFRMADKMQRDALGNLLIPPTLKDVQKILEERLDAGSYEFPAELENAVFRVKKFTREGEDFFAEQSTIKLEELTSIGLVDLDLSGLPDEVFRGLAALSMLQFLKEKMREEGWSPTKGLKLLCMHGDEEVTLASGVNVKIKEVYEKGLLGEKIQCFDENLKLAEDEIVACQKIEAPEKMFELVAENGSVLRVTPDHQMPVLKNGVVEWRQSKDIEAGDCLFSPKMLRTSSTVPSTIDLLPEEASVCGQAFEEVFEKAKQACGGRNKLSEAAGIPVQRMKSITANQRARIKEFKSFVQIAGLDWVEVKKNLLELSAHNTVIRVPAQLTPELAYLHGLVKADGYIDREGYYVELVSVDAWLHALFKEKMQACFGNVKVTRYNNSSIVSNALIARLFKNISSNVLLQFPEQFICEWLKGYADGDGSISLKASGGYSSACVTLCPSGETEARLVQDLLLRVGVHSYVNYGGGRKTRVPSGKIVDAKRIPLVIVSGVSRVKNFIGKIGFRETSKCESCERALAGMGGKSFVKQGVVPVGRLFTEIRGEVGASSKAFRGEIGIAVDNYEYGVFNPSREMVGRISGLLNDSYDETPSLKQLRKLSDSEVEFVRVKEKREVPSEEKFVYDITTKAHRNFVVNRLFSSNCVLDEAWKVAKEENSDAVMIVREGRKYQFGLIVASQNPTDISESIFSNVGTTFILRIKFERFMDYIQNSLNFSGFMRESISRFGVGECAVNMAFQTASPFSETFLLDRIDGEEPLVEYFLDIESVLGPKMGVGDLAKTYSFERTELKRKLRGFGLSDANVEEITGLFDKKNRHLDVINFVILLEKYGIARSNITLFLKDVGLEDSTIINVFGKSDQKKLGMDDKDITEVILKEEPKKK
ncbi:DUF87 domain-containing protein [Candidatus Micrarchaeota archaeon]|nr:DUF87 domain-containing protein [Candidatus Micrarchaeota archaeon]